MGDSSRRLHLIQLAGGQGQRAGADGLPPKQFRPTGHGPLFLVSLKAFLRLPAPSPAVASLTVTVPQVWCEAVAETLGSVAALREVPVQLVEAGDTRTRSTWNALQKLATLAPSLGDLVAIHDAARPFATTDLLKRLVHAALKEGGAVPGVPVADTIIQKDTHDQAAYLERSSLVAVQTPQVFGWEALYDAHRWAAESGTAFTDDGSLLAARGHQPVVVEGEMNNWKVTTDGDWRRASQLLS